MAVSPRIHNQKKEAALGMEDGPFFNMEIWKCGNVEMWKYESMEIWNVKMWKWGSGEM